MHFPNFQMRTIWWVASAAMVVFLATGWYVGRVLLGNQAMVESSRLGDSEERESGQVEDVHRFAQVNIGEENVPANIHELLLACSENTEKLSEECMNVLDAYLLQKPLSEELLSWIEFPNALTYASIFRDPVGDLERVFAVLERPECRLEEGEGFRLDLTESCDAAAIARFSQFLKVCRFGGDPTTLDQFFFAHRFLFVDPNRSMLQDNRQAESPKELEMKYLSSSGLESRWKSERCKVLNDSSLLLNPSRDARQVARLQELSQRWHIRATVHLDDYTWNLIHLRVLESLANRLGAEEAFSSTSTPFSPNVNNEWDQHIRSTRPWLEPWKQLMRFPNRRQSTLLGIDLVLGLQDVGAKFDWDHLVDLMCSRNAEDTSTCQEVIDEIKKSTEWSEVRKLQALDEFETRAIQLGLYD